MRISGKLAAGLALAAVGLSLYAASPARAAAISANPLFHRSGVWGLTNPSEGRYARSQGATFDLAPPTTGTAVLGTLQGPGYVDSRIQQLIASHLCYGQKAPHCVMSAAQEASLEAAVTTYVAAARSNPAISAYYVQDDYQGPTRATLEAVHRIIAQQGGTVKPTICAFFSPLEYRAGGTVVRNRSYFTGPLVNYTPVGCDSVAIYAYAPPVATSRVDWTMAGMMPFVRAQLKARGWVASKSLLIGVPQGFNQRGVFAMATPNSLAAQTYSFCRQGANAVVPFNWKGMSTAMRATYGIGVRACRAYVWGRR